MQMYDTVINIFLFPIVTFLPFYAKSKEDFLLVTSQYPSSYYTRTILPQQIIQIYWIVKIIRFVRKTLKLTNLSYFSLNGTFVILLSHSIFLSCIDKWICAKVFRFFEAENVITIPLPLSLSLSLSVTPHTS